MLRRTESQQTLAFRRFSCFCRFHAFDTFSADATGAGLPPAEAEFIFEPILQAASQPSVYCVSMTYGARRRHCYFLLEYFLCIYICFASYILIEVRFHISLYWYIYITFSSYIFISQMRFAYLFIYMPFRYCAFIFWYILILYFLLSVIDFLYTIFLSLLRGSFHISLYFLHAIYLRAALYFLHFYSRTAMPIFSFHVSCHAEVALYMR